MTRRALIAIVLGGCGGRAAPAAPVPIGTTTPEDPAPAAMSYGGLVAPGARWSFQVYQAQSTNFIDPSEVVFGEDAPVATCEVTESVVLGNGRAAWVTCEDFPDESRNPLFGHWAVTEAGLFELGEDLPAPMTHLDDRDVLLATHPVEREDTVEHPPESEYRETTSTTARIEQLDDDAWCHVSEYGATRGSRARVCFDAVGPVEGDWYWEDLDEIHATFFRRVEP